jgi:glutathione S-transferase
VPDILLHQYDSSPFAEKVRVCLGIKRLSWGAVDEPVIMPKPDLVALTGAYRRIPVLQIGADIYCDTQLIVRELERRFPEPTLFPAGDRGLAHAMSPWVDRTLFQWTVAIIFGGLGDKVPAAFIKDREALSGRPFDTAAMKAAVPYATAQFRAHLAWLAEQLADGRAFLTGDRPGLADANAWFNLWFVRNAYPPAAASIAPALAPWVERVAAIGHGDRREVSREDALAAALAATPVPGTVDPADAALDGRRVAVAPDDYGRDPVEGTLVASSPHHVAIRRVDPRVGTVVVHFPRVGYSITPLEDVR